MQVQINLSSPFEFRTGMVVPQFNFRGDIVLATDPSKTNMAMTIGTPTGTQLCILQFRAPGSAYDNSEYCQDFMHFLKEYLKDCNIVTFGIEAAISKHGMNHHRSSMTLTEIRANLINLAFELTGKRPLEINNWTWKAAILPEGLRSPNFKGSPLFLPEVFKSYQNDDVTDSICIYRYLIQKFWGIPPPPMFPDVVEAPLSRFRINITPGPVQGVTAVYNPALTLRENATFVANRTWKPVVFDIAAEDLELVDIYTYAAGFNPEVLCDRVKAVIVRY